MTRRRDARLFFEQQLAGATRGFHDRFDECDAEFAFFEFENAVDGATRWSSHGVFKKGRVIARFQHNTCRAFHRLRCKKGRYIPRQTDLHASFGKALPVLEHRLILRPEFEIEGLSVPEVIQQILQQIAVPR